MINLSFLSIGSFFEKYQTLAILLVLGLILGAAYYLKRIFPKLFDNKEGLKSQDEIDKEEFESLIQIQEQKEEVVEYEESEEETYFINSTNREKYKKSKDE